MRTRISVRAAVAVLALTLALAGHVVADSVAADADVVTSGSQGLINLGTVAPGSGHSLDIGFDLVCTGTSHVAVGTTITLTATPTPPSGGTIGVTNASIGPVPSSWPANGDPCVDDPVFHGATSSHVTLTAPKAAGTNYVYRITYARSPSTGTSGTTLAQILLSVEANTPPELDLPGDMTVEGDTTGGWTAAFDATATDAQDDPDPSASCSVSPGDVLPLGDTTVDCHATDTGGLTASGSFTVHVVDTTPPDLGALPSPSASTTDPSGTAVTFATPSATDVVDPSPTVACDPASGSTFPVGTTAVTCTATDASGNHASGTFDVSVTLETPPNTPPELDLPGDMTVEGDTTGGWTAAFDATATDAQDDPDPSVSCSVSPGDVLPLGDTTVDCHATDTGGLTASGSFTVHVVDTTPPDLGALPSPSASTTDPSGTAVTFATPSATDVVDPSPTVACDPASGSTFPVGTTAVTCTATDASGNHASGTFDVSVTLETPPADVRATFDEPLGDGWTTGRLGRSVPVKVDVRVDGAPLEPGTRHAPELRADRLARCDADAGVTSSIALGRLTWSSGRWVLGLDTAALGAGCWRLVVLVDGTEAGAAGLRLVEQSPGSSVGFVKLDKEKPIKGR